MNLYDIHTVMALADGPASDREHVHVDLVTDAHTQAIHRAVELLELSYALIYLEGKFRCDSYHEGKNSFCDLGETYGYINNFVRQEGGTNTFRFQYRRPLSGGKIIRQNLRMPLGGYTRHSFRRAGHEYEEELAVMIEEHYQRLRRCGKIIKKSLRSLRTTEYHMGPGCS